MPVIPVAPQEGDTGSKILFTVYDLTGALAPALLRAYQPATVDTKVLGDLGVYPTSGVLKNGWRATTGATAIALSATSIPCQGVIVKSKLANVATLYVGKSDVTADETEATGGYPLEPGESVGVPCRNVTEVFIRGTTGDKAAWIASGD